jgi:hypothetical protein
LEGHGGQLPDLTLLLLLVTLLVLLAFKELTAPNSLMVLALMQL